MPKRLAFKEESYQSKEMAAKIETLFVVSSLLKLKLHPKEKNKTKKIVIRTMKCKLKKWGKYRFEGRV